MSVKKLSVPLICTIILPVALYGCETLSLALREEHRLRMLESRVFEPETEKVMGR
jgi:hypothetical protein